MLYRTKVRTLLNVPQGQQHPSEFSHETKTPGIKNKDAAEANDLPTEDHILNLGKVAITNSGGLDTRGQCPMEHPR